MRQPWACPVMIKIARFKRASCRFFIPLLPHDSVAFVFFFANSSVAEMWQERRRTVRTRKRMIAFVIRDLRLHTLCNKRRLNKIELYRTYSCLLSCSLQVLVLHSGRRAAHIQKILMFTHAKMLHKKWNCIKKLLQEIASTNCLNKLPQ